MDIVEDGRLHRPCPNLLQLSSKVQVNGFIYWTNSDNLQIVSFSLQDESFSTLNLKPPWITKNLVFFSRYLEAAETYGCHIRDTKLVAYIFYENTKHKLKFITTTSNHFVKRFIEFLLSLIYCGIKNKNIIRSY